MNLIDSLASTIRFEVSTMSLLPVKLSAFVAAASLAIGSVVVMSPTSASAAPRGCPVSGLGCTYENNNYGGGHINFYFNVRNFADVGYWAGTLHPRTNDAAPSAFNNGTSGQSAYWHKDWKYQSPALVLGPGAGRNLGDRGLNDKVSSACFAKYCG